MMHPILNPFATLIPDITSFADETKPTAESGGAAKVLANVGLATPVSNDKQAVPTLLVKLLIALTPTLQGCVRTHNPTAIQTKAEMRHIPYSSKHERVMTHLNVPGYHIANVEVSVNLGSHTGDSTYALKLSKADKKLKIKGDPKCTVANMYPETERGGLKDCIMFFVNPRAAKPVLQVTPSLITEHHTVPRHRH